MTPNIKAVVLRDSAWTNWKRFERPEDPSEVACAVFDDPKGIDTFTEKGLPISWRQRAGTYRGEAFRVVYLLCREDGLETASVSYVAPA